MKIRKICRLFLPIVLGSIVGFIISSSIDYKNLTKPPFSPPSIIFPIVWSLLYILMGIAYYIYMKREGDHSITSLHYTQLTVNLLWPIVFFMFKLYLLSVVIICLLGMLVYFLMSYYREVSKISYMLIIPYLMWVMFAIYLNTGVYLLN